MTLISNGEISMKRSLGLLEKGTQLNVKSSSLFNACSFSKFVTSMLVMRLTDHIRLNV
ncbi:hypothetical protein ACJROX_06565 [Pseudalkalibacillus sp. A8]|uniref:hypothetical protein n=1 Tax=Pseudalkalibacillus sp. A8 TaxID=3382641 RepID=UPI0038B66E73